MISVVVVNYNRKRLLKKCLDSVRCQGFQDIEIIVVDNASSDDSVEMVSTFHPEARLIWNTRNLLFCKAYNQGIDRAKGNFILCLNNDVVLDKDYLKEALAAIGVDTRVGMVSGKILRPDREIIDSTGLFLGRNRKAVERGYGEKDIGQYETPGYVFGVSGACAFFRRGMLKDVKDANGYFDERFGMYYEDLDLCWRARKKGWRAYYTPWAVAYHERAATASAKGDSRARVFLGLSDGLKKRYILNRYRCIRKNDSPGGFLFNLPFILWYDIRVLAYILLRGILFK